MEGIFDTLRKDRKSEIAKRTYPFSNLMMTGSPYKRRSWDVSTGVVVKREVGLKPEQSQSVILTHPSDRELGHTSLNGIKDDALPSEH